MKRYLFGMFLILALAPTGCRTSGQRHLRGDFYPEHRYMATIFKTDGSMETGMLLWRSGKHDVQLLVGGKDIVVPRSEIDHICFYGNSE